MNTVLRSLKIAALGVITATLITSTLPLHAGAVESGGVGGRPAHPDPSNTRTESIFVFDVNGGDTAENGVKVFNNGSETQVVDVYPVDSQASSGGAFACAQKASERVDVGSWIKLESEQVTVEPGQNVIVPFKLMVPNDATPGEHNGCIAIQANKQTPQSAGNGISLSFRSAIRVAVTVKGDISKELQFVSVSASPAQQQGKLALTTTLRNGGNVSLDTDISVKIVSLFGTTAREANGDFPILPAGQSDFNFSVDDLFWGGFYRLEASAAYNDNVSEGLGKGSDTKTISTTEWYFAAPKPIAIIIEMVALLAVIAVIWFFVRRRNVMKRWRKNSIVYIVKPGDTLQSVAEAHSVQWKVLAKANHIKPPYALQAGQELIVMASQQSSSPPKAKPVENQEE